MEKIWKGYSSEFGSEGYPIRGRRVSKRINGQLKTFIDSQRFGLVEANQVIAVRISKIDPNLLDSVFKVVLDAQSK